MTKEQFIELTGREPELDDLDRVNCSQAGIPGHWGCGWCSDHNCPNFECACFNQSVAIDSE